MIGNEEDFTACLGFEVPDTAERPRRRWRRRNFQRMIDEVAQEYDNFAVVATTLRTVRSATVNDWGAIAWSAPTGFVEATHRPGLEILDRVGGGDSFAVRPDLRPADRPATSPRRSSTARPTGRWR